MVVVVVLPQVEVLVADEEGGERDTLMFAGQLVGGVNLVVASPAQHRLVSTAKHARLRSLACVYCGLFSTVWR